MSKIENQEGREMESGAEAQRRDEEQEWKDRTIPGWADEAIEAWMPAQREDAIRELRRRSIGRADDGLGLGDVCSDEELGRYIDAAFAREMARHKKGCHYLGTCGACEHDLCDCGAA